MGANEGEAHLISLLYDAAGQSETFAKNVPKPQSMGVQDARDPARAVRQNPFGSCPRPKGATSSPQKIPEVAAEVPDFIVCPRMLSYVYGIGIGTLYFSRL